MCTGKGTAYAEFACGEETTLTYGVSAEGNDGHMLCNACYQKMKRRRHVKGTCTGKGRRAKAK